MPARVDTNQLAPLYEPQVSPPNDGRSRVNRHLHLRRATDAIWDFGLFAFSRRSRDHYGGCRAQFIESRLERLEYAYRRGLSHLQLVQEQDDLISPLGDVYTAASQLGGLTPFGAESIRECNRLCILVGLAHGSYDMVPAAFKVANQPLIISHAGTVNDARGKSLSADLRKRRVGIDTDTDLTASFVLPYTDKIWPDQNAGFFYAVLGKMLKQGFAFCAGRNFQNWWGQLRSCFCPGYRVSHPSSIRVPSKF